MPACAEGVACIATRGPHLEQPIFSVNGFALSRNQNVQPAQNMPESNSDRGQTRIAAAAAAAATMAAGSGPMSLGGRERRQPPALNALTGRRKCTALLRHEQWSLLWTK